jgi:hypothetical protein
MARSALLVREDAVLGDVSVPARAARVMVARLAVMPDGVDERICNPVVGVDLDQPKDCPHV